ncbi:2-C-methyl-D-erythritol 2,4-cyclodiphosphate synthase, partial [Treponema pallidum]
ALHPFREAMRASLAQALDTHVTRVFVKAKTAERLGPVGSGAAVTAQVVVLLKKI